VAALLLDVRHHARMSDGTEGRDVLSSLPHSRPQRRSAKRDAAASKPARKARSSSSRAKSSRPAAASKPRAAAAKRRAKAKPKVGGTPRPSAATRRAREESVAVPASAQQPAERDGVTTVIEAAGELARLGITVGTQLVREATRRLPRP
jgi:hypothetical protein